MAKFKQLCNKCRKNYVTVSRRQYAICYNCQKDKLQACPIDPEMRAFFDIPEEYYKQNGFLRNIKLSYLRSGSLTEKQKEAFKKAVDELKNA